MALRRGDAELQVRASFQVTRTAALCLAAAYERLVPIARRPTAKAPRSEAAPEIAAAAEPPQHRKAERG